MTSLAVLCLVTASLGEADKAQRLAEAARGIAARGNLGKAAQSSLAYAAMGVAYAARGELQQGRSELQYALELRRRVPGLTPWTTMDISLLLAQVLLDLGDRAGAAELRDEVSAALSIVPDGAGGLRTRLAALERRLSGSSRAVSVAEPLTDREVAVLRLLAGTLSLREIGQEMFVSANTVKTHTQRIYRKLGVGTRHDAVRRGKQDGLL